MFSPRAENLLMPGRPPAAPRSRWRKLPLLAISADQSPATRARSPSQSRAARPLARRSALSRSKRSLASFWAVLWLPAGAGRVVGAAVGRGAGLVVVVVPLVVVVAALVVVVGRTGRRVVLGVSAALASSGAGAAAAARSWPNGRPAPGLALAGSRAQASSSGSTIRPAILRLPRHGALARACLGRALEPRGAGWWLRKLASLSGEAGQGVTKAAVRRTRGSGAPLPCRWPNGGLGGWPTTAVPFQIRRLSVKPAE